MNLIEACNAIIGLSDAGIDWLSGEIGGPEPSEVRAIRDAVGEDPDNLVTETIALARAFTAEHCYDPQSGVMAKAECSCGAWNGPPRRSDAARRADYRLHVRAVLTDLRAMAVDGDPKEDAKRDPALEARVAADNAKGLPTDNLTITHDVPKPEPVYPERPYTDCAHDWAVNNGGMSPRNWNPCGRCDACNGVARID